MISNQGGTIQSDEREKVHTILASSKNCQFLVISNKIYTLCISSNFSDVKCRNSLVLATGLEENLELLLFMN